MIRLLILGILYLITLPFLGLATISISIVAILLSSIEKVRGIKHD
jgi:hypothetical protein